MDGEYIPYIVMEVFCAVYAAVIFSVCGPRSAANANSRRSGG